MKFIVSNARKLITILSVLSILAVSIFSVFTGVDFTAVAETTQNVEVWGGYTDNTNNVTLSGSGTVSDPYRITNGDELWKMIKNYGVIGGGSKAVIYDSKSGSFRLENENGAEVSPAHYRLENDIYLNDITNYDSWGTDGFDMSTLNNWRENDGVTANFFGHLDGNGHTIYGLYAKADTQVAFIANVGKDATIKNLHFRNTYILNTYDLGRAVGTSVDATTNWNICSKGSASVIGAYYTGDGNNYTVDAVISNCSIIGAYVESKYTAAGVIGYIDGSVPEVKNCIIADTELVSTELDHTGAVVNSTWGPYEKVATIEAVISLGNPLYGTGYFKAWDGHKHPHATCMYNFKDCYSDVRHNFTIEHPENGTLTFSDTSINLTKLNKVIGEAAKDNLDIDWAHNWRTTDSYPIPNNEYIVPTGDDYYANGGPASSKDYWDGKTAKTYAAGTGTIDDPYLIENCGQFYKMVSTLNTTDYFKIADGVTDLYFNKVEGMTYEQAVEYLSKSKRANVYAPGQNNFGGYFDGNGVTIHGVKAVQELTAALFPKVNTCTIKNFTIKNSYIYAPDDNKSETTVEGAAAVIADLNNNAAVNLRNIAVIDCNINSPIKSAGLVACSHTGGCVFIDDCIVAGGEITSDEGTVSTAAFVAASNSGTHTIKNSISIGVYPAADNKQSYGSTFINVYTSFNPPSSLVEQAAVGVIEVDDDALKGEAVKATAKEFDWTNTWTATADIPMPKVHKAVFGTAGSAWTGNISDGFAGGNGSAGDPYQIDTAERFAQMVMYCKPGAYYELTEDIYLNDTSVANWTANAKNWFTTESVFPFTGILNGRGKTVYGLYYANVNAGAYAGLVPSLGSGGQIRNLFVADASLNGAAGAVMGAVVGTVADGASNTATVRACYVDDTVKFSGAANAAGVVGRVGLAKLKLDNSLSAADLSAVTGTKAGISGDISGKLEVKECISVGTKPFATMNGVSAPAFNYFKDELDQKDIAALKAIASELGTPYEAALDKTDLIVQILASEGNTYQQAELDEKEFDEIKEIATEKGIALSVDLSKDDIINGIIALDNRSIYSDVAVEKDSVVKLVSADNMKGESAKTYLTALDFNEGGTWTTITDDYPAPTGQTKPFDGVKGEPWSGEVALNFAGGTGTPADPYLIATGEQLALMLQKYDSSGYVTGNFKLIADIYLNDVYDPLWKDLVGCSSWYSSYEVTSTFVGTFDGDGYAVFGMYYNNPSAPKNTFVGLFPRFGNSGVIKNVAISHAYIDANRTESESYAGAIFGMAGTFYDSAHNLYSNKAGPSDTVGDEYMGKKLPVIECCIVDHNSVIIGGNVGGIGNPGGGAIVVRDCIVTATLTGEAAKREGVLIGNAWAGGSRLYTSFAFPQNDAQSSGGSHQWVEDEASIVYYHENVYYYGSKYIYGTTNIPRPQWRVGEEVKTAAPNVDWVNVWRTEPEGTPIPRIFDKEGRSGSIFSDKTFLIPDVQINFITGDEAIKVDPIIGKPYTKATLPTISRLGYKFTGWYSFADITLEYPYDYFLSRDINLYAGWEKLGIIQGFEDYLYSSYDCDLDRWNYNKPGSRGGYNFDYVHTGTKSMQLLDNSAESADLLLNYEEWLTVGQNYKITFFVATDKADTQATLSLVQNNHPDYLNTEVKVEPIVTVNGQKIGEWKQYSFEFTAETNWVSIRATGNSSLFIDDVVIAPTGDIIENNNTVIDLSTNGSGNSQGNTSGDSNVVSPNTTDGITVAILISVIVACAIVVVVSKKNFSEVIDNI